MITLIEEQLYKASNWLTPKQPKIYNPYVEPILAILYTTSSKNPVSKFKLYEKMGLLTALEKRRARHTIAGLSKTHLIGSSSSGVNGGYYLIQTREDLDKSVGECRSRAFQSWERARNLETLWEQECHRKLIDVPIEVNIPFPGFMS